MTFSSKKEREHLVDVSLTGAIIFKFVPKSIKMEAAANIFWLNVFIEKSSNFTYTLQNEPSPQDNRENLVDVSSTGGSIVMPKSNKMEAVVNTFWLISLIGKVPNLSSYLMKLKEARKDELKLAFKN